MSNITDCDPRKDDPVSNLIANSAPTVGLTHQENNQSYTITVQTFGALSDESSNPLSCVSVANSSLSIDMWKGCAWQCAYCHVHDAQVNHADGTMRMPNRPTPRTNHSPEDIIEALITHPFFEANKTILSIGTASTEPFDSRIIGQVFDLIENLQRKGFRNPIWVVTKNGVPDAALDRMATVIKNCDNFILSLTSGGLDNRIEPVQNPRFKNAEKAAAMGAKIILYLRPILEEWGSTPEKITKILEQANLAIGKQRFSAIAPGGLRWAEGVEIALLSHGLSWPESLSKHEDRKEIPDHIMSHIEKESERLFPGIPLVLHSSCALSNTIECADISMTYRRKVNECVESKCPDEQRQKCHQAYLNIGAEIVPEVNAHLQSIGIPPLLEGFDNAGNLIFPVASGSALRYAIKRTVLKIVASIASANKESNEK